MPSPGYELARQRLIAYRYTRDPRPRLRVRIDPIPRDATLVTILGLCLIMLARLLKPLET